MILSEMKSYLIERRRAPIGDLAARFGVETDALRSMLDVWVRKGRLRRVDGGACGSCCGCAAAGAEIYEWTGNGTVS